jgi:LuxR family transcriptional regulator, activator of conjugal transfer of Ti plasmids
MADMSLIFQRFMDSIGAAGGAGDLTEAMRRFAGGIGLTRFAYLDFRRPDTEPPVYLTTYPIEWVYHYMGRRYHEIDPVIAQARSGVLPFFWDEATTGREGSREQRRFFGEAAEFGIRCGLSIPIRDDQTRLALVSLASDGKPAEMTRDVDRHRSMLHLAALYLHVHARQKLQDAVPSEGANLSAEERACLQWVVQGKSAWDIGEVLTIPQGTVVHFLKNAKQKLRATTLSQAVATALYHKLIEL